jgi:hypothetical protein
MTLNPLTELGPSNPIYPFMLLSQYRILVCQKCQYACLAREVTTHLAKKHPGIDLWTRRRLVESIEVLPDVLRTRAELPQLQYPLPTNEPIPCLAPPTVCSRGGNSTEYNKTGSYTSLGYPCTRRVFHISSNYHTYWPVHA